MAKPASKPARSENQMLKVGDKAPDFELQAADGLEVTLSGLRGKPVVLYFFPKALTSG
jgi:peroxiredoxin Q/BCP